MKKQTLLRIVVFLVIGFLTIGLYSETSRLDVKKLNVKDGYIEFLGGKTWYKILSPEKRGIPLILVHGGPGVNSWYLDSLEIVAHQRPVILYDQRGGGFSDPLPKEYWNIDFFVEELNQLIKQLGLIRYHLLGHSWGGAILTDFALTQPQGLVSLIYSSPLISTPLWIDDQKKLLKSLPEDIQEIVYNAELTKDYSSPEYQEAMGIYYNLHLCRLDPWPDLLVQSLSVQNSDIYSNMWGPSEFTCTGSLQNYDRSDSLYQIEVPTLFTCGKYDEATPETVQFYADKMPNAKVKVFDKSSHTAMFEEPFSFINNVRIFLIQSERLFRMRNRMLQY